MSNIDACADDEHRLTYLISVGASSATASRAEDESVTRLSRHVAHQAASTLVRAGHGWRDAGNLTLKLSGWSQKPKY
eukprot:5253221-Prymnesium_polylepis.2